MWRQPDRGAKQAGEMKRAHPRPVGEREQRDVVVQVVVDEIDNGAKLPRIQLSRGSGTLGFAIAVVGEQVEDESHRQCLRVERALGAPAASSRRNASV